MNLLQVLWQKIAWFWQMSVKKKLLFSIIPLLLIGYLVKTISSQKNAPQYQTAQVERGTLITTVSASGSISNGSNVNIVTSATGIVSQVYVKNGDSVTQGDKIAEITLDQNSQQKQQAAWANYLSAKNSLSSAQAKLNSLQSALFKANQTFMTGTGISGISHDDPKYIEQNAEWLQAEADYKNQTNVIDQAQAALSSAWLSYQQISPTIIAPSTGAVTNLTISPGVAIVGNDSSTSSTSTTSNSSSSQTVGSITIQQNGVQALVSLSETDVAKVSIGQKATLTLDALPDKTFTGHVAAINTSGVVSSGVVAYPTTIILDTASNNIYPNMGVTAQIITEVKDNVLLVPSSAVQTQSGQKTIRTLVNGSIQQNPVETGDSSDTQTEVKSGVSEGQQVVTRVITQASASTSTSSPFGRTGFGGGGIRRGN